MDDFDEIKKYEYNESDKTLNNNLKLWNEIYNFIHQ